MPELITKNNRLEYEQRPRFENGYVLRDDEKTPMSETPRCHGWQIPLDIKKLCECATRFYESSNTILEPEISTIQSIVKETMLPNFILYAPETKNIENEFVALMNDWEEETAFFSSVTKKCVHHSYQRIIGMGLKALPLILRELKRETNHWFWALTAITGENPVASADEGNMDKMREAWLQLGRKRGWID